MSLFPPNDGDWMAASMWIGTHMRSLRGVVAPETIDEMNESLAHFLAAFRAGVADELRAQLAPLPPADSGPKIDG